MKITVGVVGLGLIGASFAKAYKENEKDAVDKLAKIREADITEAERKLIFCDNARRLLGW